MNVQRLYIELNYCAFESFPLTLNEVKLLVETVLMSVQVFLALGACLPPAMLPIQPLYTFSLPSRFFGSPYMIHVPQFPQKTLSRCDILHETISDITY